MQNKRTSYKLLSLDLDGTLLSPILKRVHKKDCLVIQEYASAGGIPFINTGRAPWAIVKTIKRINSAGPNRLRLMSCWNGAYLHDFNDGEVIVHTIPHSICKKVYEIVKNNGGMVWFHTERSKENNTIHIYPFNPIIRLGYHLAHLRPIKDLEDYTSFKIDILSPNKSLVANIYKELLDAGINFEANVIHSSSRLIEITPLNINKSYAINYFANKYKIHKSEIAALGDSFNDLSAFKCSGLSIGISPKNSELLQYCLAVVDHKTNGVKQAIDTYILKPWDDTHCKLIFSDLDGTLIDQKTKLFSNKTKIALQQCTNRLIPIAIASGRGIYDCRNIVKSMVLNPKTNIYIVGNNGAVIYDIYTKRYISQSPIDELEAQKVFELTKDYCDKHNGDTGFIIHQHSEDLLFYNEPFWKVVNYKKTGSEDKYDQWIERNPIYITEYEEDIICYKFVIKFPNHERALEGFEIFKKKFPNLEICLSSDVNLDINKKGINKGAAMLRIAKKLKVNLDDTIVLGDGQNDIEALKLSKNSYTPCYAKDFVKACANHVVENVDISDFASDVINNHVLKKEE